MKTKTVCVTPERICFMSWMKVVIFLLSLSRNDPMQCDHSSVRSRVHSYYKDALVAFDSVLVDSKNKLYPALAVLSRQIVTASTISFGWH